MSEAYAMEANPSGIYPYFERILVKPDEIEETTDGGIIIPDQIKERHGQAQATGTLIAIGPDAFVDSRTAIYQVGQDGRRCLIEERTEGPATETTPRIGDRVVFAKYGGLPVTGADGIEYRLLNDRDLTARATEEVTYQGIESRKAVAFR